MPPAEAAPSWSDFVAGLELFRDPIVCGAAAGLVLGFLGVYIVLRRMVFVSAAITHSAGLGVALAYYAQIHLGLARARQPDRRRLPLRPRVDAAPRRQPAPPAADPRERDRAGLHPLLGRRRS